MMKSAESIKKSNMLCLAEYQRQLWEKPKLTMLFFELTDRCNLNCKHCGSSCSLLNSAYLDSKLIKRIIESVASKYKANDIMIALTGGEPLLHPECIEIIKYAHEKGFLVGMTSNGTLIDSDIAAKLKKSGLDTISISIDGIGFSHDELRDTMGAYDNAVKGIHALKDASLEPQVTTVVHKGNIAKLDEIYGFILDNDIYSWRLTNVEPIGRARDSKDLLLDYHDMMKLFEYIRNKRMTSCNNIEITYGCAHFLPYRYERTVRNFYFQCVAGTQVASIMAKGDIGACLDIERRRDIIQGNAYSDDFIEVWENRFRIFRRNKAESSNKCRICIHKEVCMGDSAHTWDYDYNEPLYCLRVWEEQGAL